MIRSEGGVRLLSALIAVAAFCVATAGMVVLALGQRRQPARCAAGLSAMGFRCCAEGQRFDGSHCVGAPRACPSPLLKSDAGCVARDLRVTYEGGAISGTSADWQSDLEPPSGKVAPFALDAFEVTVHRWERCVAAGQCEPVPVAEPGLPVTGVDPDTAQHFCRFAGGRLPTSAEWLFAAMGREGRRYPWGMTGLVCRRAVYGLSDGCAVDATGPEWSGTRTDGATPEGVYDLAGNVAEWTLEPDGRAVARGGSFRSSSARELKCTSMEDAKPGADVGFRCAYDVERR